jgi:hypothetical protein
MVFVSVIYARLQGIGKSPPGGLSEPDALMGIKVEQIVAKIKGRIVAKF